MSKVKSLVAVCGKGSAHIAIGFSAFLIFFVLAQAKCFAADLEEEQSSSSTKGSAPASGGSSSMSVEERRQMVRQYLSRGGQESSGKKSSPTPKRSILDSKSETNFRTRALDEINTSNESRSSGLSTTSATVVTRSLTKDNPVKYLNLKLGLSLSHYQPQGQVPVATLGSKDLGELSPATMWGMELATLPWSYEALGVETLVGLRVGVGYSQSDVALYGPTGISLGQTRLTSLLSRVLVSQQWQIDQSRGIFWNFGFGPARLDMIQQGESTLADQSDSMWLGVLQTGPSYEWRDFAFDLSYEYRTPLSDTQWSSVESSTFGVGVTYDLR